MNDQLEKNCIMHPSKGESIFIPSSLYLTHGRDDVQGGIAYIDNIIPSDHLDEDHINYYMVTLKGFPSSAQWNYRSLMREQEGLKSKYKDEIAHPDPDFHPDCNPPNYGW